jgi:hypothetical protein
MLVADNAMAQRGGAVPGGMRGAAIGGMVGGQEAARVGAVVDATRGAVNREQQVRAKYYTTPEYQNSPRSDFNAAPPQIFATAAPAAASPSPAATTSGGETVLRKDGKPVVGITYPADWKQSTGEHQVTVVSPDGQAWSGMALLSGVTNKQAGINKIKEEIENHLTEVSYDQLAMSKNGTLFVIGSGKGKMTGVDVIFAVCILDAGKSQLVGVAFVVDSKIEDHYKDTIGSICETIRSTNDFAK